ncbi:MAG: hypothetical protein AAF471_09035, partial [Myxococcota bacterium]
PSPAIKRQLPRGQRMQACQLCTFLWQSLCCGRLLALEERRRATSRHVHAACMHIIPYQTGLTGFSHQSASRTREKKTLQ